jgi:hypothetical protein
MRLLCFLISLAPLFAACPTSTDRKGISWTNACVVAARAMSQPSCNGHSDGLTDAPSDSSGTGTFCKPYATIGKAYVMMTTSDDVILRAGRYAGAGTGNTFASGSVTKSGTSSDPIVFRSYPGEVPIVDGDLFTSNFFGAQVGSPNVDPPYGNDPKVSYWHIVGIRFENIAKQFMALQSEHHGVELRGLRGVNTSSLGSTSSCEDCKILGTYWHQGRPNISTGTFTGLLDCSPIAPGNDYVPIPATQSNTPTYWQFANTAPRLPALQAFGCVDFTVQDSVFERSDVQSSTDIVGSELGNRLLFERVKVIGPRHWANDASYANGDASTDILDLKATDVTLHDVVALGGKAAIKVWGKVNIRNAWGVQGDETMPEPGLSTLMVMGTPASRGFPENTPKQGLRYVYNDSNAGQAVIFSQTDVYLAPMVGLEIVIEDVPGCTALNGVRRISKIWESKHLVFSVTDLGGNPISCNGPYDLSQSIFETHDRTATLTAGSTSVVWTGASLYGCQFCTNNRVRFTTTGTLPPEITTGADYWVVTSSGSGSGSTMTVSDTRGGTPITFSSSGTGSHTMTIIDEFTSYAGTMKVYLNPNPAQDTYGSKVQYSTIMSTRSLVHDGCGGCNLGVDPPKWTYNNDIFSAQKMAPFVSPLVFFARPRVKFSGSTVYLSDWDSNALAIGKTVYFDTTGTLPSPAARYTPYYIVAADSSAGTIHVAASPGGVPLTFSSETVAMSKHRLVAEGFQSPNVEVTALTSLSPGTALSFLPGTGGSLPYPLAPAALFYVHSTSTVSVNGTSVYQIQVKTTPGGSTPLVFNTSGLGWNRAFVTTGSPNYTGQVFKMNYLTNRYNTGGNIYWSPSAIPTEAYCAKTKLNDGVNATTCAATAAEVSQIEPGSLLTDPGVSFATARATAATPPSAWNKGYYSGTDSVDAGVSAALLQWKAPESADSCTVGLYGDAGLSGLLELQTSNGGRRWRQVVLGSSAPLTANTNYWYKVQCGFDVMTGTFQTQHPGSGPATLTVLLGSRPGAAQAVLEVSPDAVTWTSGSVVSCSSGCLLSNTAIPANTVTWYRWRLLDSSGSVLARSEKSAAVVR